MALTRLLRDSQKSHHDGKIYTFTQQTICPKGAVGAAIYQVVQITMDKQTFGADIRHLTTELKRLRLQSEKTDCSEKTNELRELEKAMRSCSFYGSPSGHNSVFMKFHVDDIKLATLLFRNFHRKWHTWFNCNPETERNSFYKHIDNALIGLLSEVANCGCGHCGSGLFGINR